jgi:hypothetical protein
VKSFGVRIWPKRTTRRYQPSRIARTKNARRVEGNNERENDLLRRRGEPEFVYPMNQTFGSTESEYPFALRQVGQLSQFRMRTSHGEPKPRPCVLNPAPLTPNI